MLLAAMLRWLSGFSSRSKAVASILMESLILAQDERWRRA
jgi:hypothetical protein